MYLTRLELDIKKRKTLLAFASPSIFHGLVESAFIGERKRNLWRIDNLNGSYYLLILSEDKPDLTNVTKEIGVGDSWETKDYNILLSRVSNDSSWHFRLTANPTYTVKTEGKQRGRVCAHSVAKYQRMWLVNQASKHGFYVGEEEFEIVESKWQHFYKGRGNNKSNKVSILTVTFEGVLKVTDSDLFKQMLVSGIGRQKAYGVGLLTLVR